MLQISDGFNVKSSEGFWLKGLLMGVLMLLVNFGKWQCHLSCCTFPSYPSIMSHNYNPYIAMEWGLARKSGLVDYNNFL